MKDNFFFSLGICPIGIISLLQPISTYFPEEQTRRAQSDFNDRTFTFNYAHTQIKKDNGQIDSENCLVFFFYFFYLGRMHESAEGFPRAFKRVYIPQGSTSINIIADGHLINGVVVPYAFIRSDGKLVYTINPSFVTRTDSTLFTNGQVLETSSLPISYFKTCT